MSLRDLFKERPGTASPRQIDDFFWRMFQALRVTVSNKLTSEQLLELSTLTECDQDRAIDIMTEKDMSEQLIVPPSWRYMVKCEACGCERPLPVKEESVKECGWCNVFKRSQ